MKAELMDKSMPFEPDAERYARERKYGFESLRKLERLLGLASRRDQCAFSGRLLTVPSSPEKEGGR